MGKIICKKCGKIFSDVESFCPKCEAPAEISKAAPMVGGRHMAQAGTGIGREGEQEFCRSEDHSKARHGKTFYNGGVNPSEYIKFKNIIAIIAVVVIVLVVIMFASRLSIVNDSNSENPGFNVYTDVNQPEYYYDEDDYFSYNDDGSQFMEALQTALQNRCQMAAELATADLTEEGLMDARRRMVEAEYELLSDYENLDLGGEGLNYYRDSYFSGLEMQNEAINNTQFTDLWVSGYNLRVEAVIDIVDLYGTITLPEEIEQIYRDSYDDLYGGIYNNYGMNTYYNDSDMTDIIIY